MLLETQPGSSSDVSTESWTSDRSSNPSSDWARSSADDSNHRCIATLAGHSGPVSSLAVSGNIVYSGGPDGSDIRVWRQPDFVEISKFGSGDGCVKAILVSGGRVFSAHQDNKIRVWKTSQGVEQPKLITSLPTLKDYLLRCVPSKNYVQVRRHKKRLWIEHVDTISVLAINGSLDLLYSGSWDKTVKVWRTSDFKCLESITAHDDAVNALAVDHQGFLYTGSADCKVKVWSKIEKKKHCLVATLARHKSSVNALALSPDESLLYCGSGDNTVTVWERVDIEEHMIPVGVLRGHRQAVLCVACAGNVLCSGSADKTVRVWRRGAENFHSCIAKLEGHRGPVRSISVTLDGFVEGIIVYTGSQDRSVKLWWIAATKDEFSQDECISSPMNHLKF